jgi:hypothetical protein
MEKKFLTCALLINCFTLIISLPTFATIRYVKAGHTGNGLSWITASGDLQGIILISQPGDQVWIAEGTYKPTTTSDRFASFLLKEGVALYGSFSGIETSIAEREIANYPTILSGDIDAVGNNDSYHVIRPFAPTSITTNLTILDGFTITGGWADDPTLNGSGYAPYAVGAGMILENASPIIRNCRFISNYAFLEGGAVYSLNGSPIFTNCEFSFNVTDEGSDLGGGALFLDGQSYVDFENCLFFSNNANFGGAIVTWYGTSIHVNGCIFKENNARDQVGALVLFDIGVSPHSISNSLFYYNTDHEADDGITDIATYTLIPVTNCTFYQKPDQRGCSISGIADLYNSILWGRNQMLNNGGVFHVSHSIVQGGFSGCVDCPNVNGDTDPLFANINDADGADNIMGTTDDGLRLSAFSPGINAGLNGIPGYTYIDVTGATRSGILDIGAYEGGVCSNASVTRLYVNSSANNSNGTGGSWTNAFTDLQIALEAARACNAANEIWVARGTYKPTATSDRTKYFSMINGVGIYGGFDGTETQLGQRNWTKNPAILSGNIDPVGNADAYRIITNKDLNNTAVLDGFTISGAYNDEAGGTSDGNGAGVFNFQSSPVFRNCSIRNNHADNVGGGIYNNVSGPLLINCAVAYNSSNGGAGMANYNSEPVLKNCVLAFNSSANNGGAMSNVFGSTPQLINCTVVKNTAVAAGDGIYNQLNSSPVITNSLSWNNGGAGNEIVNQDVASVPVVSYSHIQGGYAGCSNCTNAAINPDMINIDDADGPDNIFGTPDDGLQLMTNSPCVNQGNNVVVTILTDITNNPRIQNSTVNIGAYENNYVISLGNGSWNSANNWNVNRVPLNSDWVMIKAGHVITVVSGGPGAICHGTVIMPGANLILNGKLNVQ